MKIYLDNILVQNPTESLLFPTFTIRSVDEDGAAAFSYSGDVTFVETEYNYIYGILKTSPNARTNEVEVKFVDDCCQNKEYLFKITHETIRWCEDKCELTCNLIEKSVTSDQVTCLKNTMIYDNWNGFQNQAHPRFVYCNELRPNWMHHVLLILVILMGILVAALSPVFIVFAIIVTIINAIIGVLNNAFNLGWNLIDFDNNQNTTVWQEFINYYNQLMSWAIGCGRKHPSPLVRNYANNVCGKCGLQFTSSIFSGSSPYLNLAYVSAPVHKGTLATDNTTYWIDENKPLLNGLLFFDQLKIMFNARWKVKNNQLFFERKDNLNVAPPFLDLTSYDKNKYDVCWEWQRKPMAAYGNYRYMADAVNWIGTEAHGRWNDIVEWNNPYTPAQKGEHAPLIPFAACRFRDDGIDTDVLTYYQYVPLIGPTIQAANRAMIINSHNSYQPMLIIWDPTTGVQNAKCDNGSVYFPGYYTQAGQPVNNNQFYNYWMWFQEGYANNLYTNFHFIDDPRTSNFKGLQFSARVDMTCDLLNNFDVDGRIITSEGISKEIFEITLNFKEGIITIKGVV